MRQKEMICGVLIAWSLMLVGGRVTAGPVADIMVISDVFSPGDQIDVWVTAVNPTHEFEVDVYLSAATEDSTLYLSPWGWGTQQVPFIAAYMMPQFREPLTLKLASVTAGQLPSPAGQRCTLRLWVTPSNVPDMVYCDDCVTFSTAPDGFVAVPSARFVMGKYDPGTGPEWLIKHEACLSSFFFSRCETTCVEFAEFLNSAGATATDDGLVLGPDGKIFGRTASPGWWPSHLEYVDGSFSVTPGFESHPATAFFAGCQEYAKWRGAELPTEAQWEHAARAFVETDYPWGDEMSCDHANTMTSSQGPCHDGAVRVASYEPNSVGAYDVIGNVSEFCIDFCDWDSISRGKPSYYRWCLDNYPYGIVDPTGPDLGYDDSGQWRGTIMRGGHYGDDFRLWGRAPTGDHHWDGCRLVVMPAH